MSTSYTQSIKISVLAAIFTAAIWFILPVFIAEDQPYIIILLACIVQALLVFFVFFLWTQSPEWRNPFIGPGLISALSIHALMFYGPLNIPSMMFPFKAAQSNYAAPIYFLIGTISALLEFIGTVLGISIVRILAHDRKPKYACELWLPRRQTALFVGLSITMGLIYNVFKYPARIMMLEMADEPIFYQLIYYGVEYCLGFGPFFVAVGLSEHLKNKHHHMSKLLFGIVLFVNFSCFIIWGMRTWSMISLTLPFVFLFFKSKIQIKKFTVWILLIGLVAYSFVTIFRYSHATVFIERAAQTKTGVFIDISLMDLFALSTQPLGDSSVAGNWLYDLSYHFAGLDPVAAALVAQAENRVAPQLGKVIYSGVMSALPHWLRPEGAIENSSKLIGINLGILRPMDNIITSLFENVVDFGPIFLIIPSLVMGFILGMIDRLLYKAGENLKLEGFRVVRIVWLLGLCFGAMSFGSSTIDSAKRLSGLMFFVVCGSWAIAFWQRCKIRFRVAI